MNSDTGRRILLVDDDRHLLITLSDYLTFVGFEVATAPSAEDALKSIEKQEPDLVILDISMPGMGGMGFLRQIRTAEGKCRYPVIVLTARAGMEDFFENMDVEGFLAKPCSESALERKIREVLARKAARSAQAERRMVRVLLGEDDSFVVGRIRKALETAGFAVDVAETGPDVLSRSTGSRPDAILLKEMLPRMNGSVIAPLVKAMPNTAAVPVLLYDVSRNAVDDHRFHHEAPAGVARFLETDDPDRLTQAVRDVLAGPRA